MLTNYDIVVTLGPASQTTAIWHALLDAGATAFRLNTSHLTLPELQRWLDQLEPFLAASQPRPPLVLDLQGSKWRLGDFAPCTLTVGQHVELVYAAVTDQADVLPVPHLDFFQAASVSSDAIVLNDAKIRLAREAFGAEWLRATVIDGGELSSHKGLTYSASAYRKETLSEKDRTIFEQTRQFEQTRYAISYMRDAVEMFKYRTHFGPSAYLIAKLERGPAMTEAQSIADAADEVWVCRGDLGAELGLRAMAEAVRRFSETVADSPVPALMAGQVLEHMTERPTPTRSEVCYLHDTLLQGYRGFVLSDEVAIGCYPIESCRTAALFRAEK